MMTNTCFSYQEGIPVLKQTIFILFFLLLLDASCMHFLNRGYRIEPVRRETSVIAGH